MDSIPSITVSSAKGTNSDQSTILTEIFKQDSEKLLFSIQVQVISKNMRPSLASNNSAAISPTNNHGTTISHTSSVLSHTSPRKRFQSKLAEFMSSESNATRSFSNIASPVSIASASTQATDLDTASQLGGQVKGKTRVICLTMRPSGKIRLHKVKPGAVPQISKTWAIEDVKSLEICSPTLIAVNLGKQYLWQVEDALSKFEFLYYMIKFCKKSKRTPKLINFTEDSINEEIQVFKNREKARDEDRDEDENQGADVNLSPIDDAYFSFHYGSEFNIDEVLHDFKWQAGGDASALEQRFASELLALEAANLHAIIQAEEQSGIVVQQISHAISELDKIDEWLNLYYNELLNMGKDIQYIESQNKGLQIQSNNQKLLKNDLGNFLNALELPDSIPETLKNESLDKDDGIKRLEDAILTIQKALQTKFEDPINEMAAISERFGLFNKYANSFFQRLHKYLTNIIAEESKPPVEVKIHPKISEIQLNINYNVTEALLPYRSLVAKMKEMNPREQHELQLYYAEHMHRYYSVCIKEFFESMKTRLSKKSPDEMSYLFSSNARLGGFGHLLAPLQVGTRSGSMVSLIGKHKKNPSSENPAGSFDDITGGGNKATSKGRGRGEASNQMDAGERLTPPEAMDLFFRLFTCMLLKEQNFILNYFVSPDMKQAFILSELEKCRPLSKDLKIRKRVEELLDMMFDGIFMDTLTYFDSSLKHDLTVVVGVLYVLEKYRNSSETVQIGKDEPVVIKLTETIPFYSRYISSLHEKLLLILEKFVDEQIRAIEDTKMSLKTRSGVLPFIRVFPYFVRRFESLIKDATEEYEIRTKVNEGLNNVVKVIFTNLEAIAKEVDAESLDDKEQMNAHILTIVNMHHLYSEMRGLKVSSLDAHMKTAKIHYDLHLNAYIKAVIRKPLGKLLLFFEGMEELLKTKQPDEIPYHLNFNKSAIKKCLSAHPGKEIKKSLESLYKRVNKHYNDEEGLLQVVWHGIQEEFIHMHTHFESLIKKCYSESDIHLMFTVEDLCTFFSEIARAH